MLAAGARADEFSGRPERVVKVMPGQREMYEQKEEVHGRWGRWDGITERVREEMAKGGQWSLDGLSETMKVCRERVAKAVNRLITRGLVLSNKKRPATYVLSSRGGFSDE